MKKSRNAPRADTTIYVLVVFSMLSSIAAVVMGSLNAAQVIPGTKLKHHCFVIT